ncbi:coatomer subunit zeta [[Candida] anglica]|uniref:Coatomer subunit zeta n=1 Tax=[Candida] anglica TaxID=148631 RepID=A0ABP0E956_9ASCO
MSNVSLKTVSACLILDSHGSRLYSKYYSKEAYATQTQQLEFEANVFKKVYKQNQDIILYDNHLITYKQSNDVVLILVAALSENESLIYSLTSNLIDALNILLDNTLDEVTILEKYDLVSLCIDETIDDGIILEIDPAIIVSRVTDPRNANNISSEMSLNKIDLSEKGLFNALSFASKKIGERLQQGL